MKTKICVAVATIAMILFAGTVQAQTKPYTNGSVWDVTFIQIKPGMGDDYVASLKTTWKAMHEEGIKQGLILSYKILWGASANPDDWEMMLMEEYKSMAAMESAEDKWEAISKTVVGGDDAMKTLMQSRTPMREIYGSKMMREIHFK